MVNQGIFGDLIDTIEPISLKLRKLFKCLALNKTFFKDNTTAGYFYLYDFIFT